MKFMKFYLKVSLKLFFSIKFSRDKMSWNILSLPATDAWREFILRRRTSYIAKLSSSSSSSSDK